MPVIECAYRAPLLLKNGHTQTVLGAYKPVARIPYERVRIETPDGDFLDIDQAVPLRRERRLVIISYGMEGDSQRRYVRAMVRAMKASGRDVWVWNYRGASGEPNRKVHFYHGGLIDDLGMVILEARIQGYLFIDLIGFSLGGNLVLNYLGKLGYRVPGEIRSAVCFSVPCDVEDCARQLQRRDNRFYIRRFLQSFRERIRQKMHVMPGRIDDLGFEEITSLEAYDERYTVPHFGFDGVPQFYRWVSSKYTLSGVQRRTLIVNALDDPFLGPDCFPREAAEKNPDLTLEISRHGGHLGFLGWNPVATGWMERRALAFLDTNPS
ncbi:MAG TPA: alpha/beta hydrolase [Kiritimatiellia bacterium]|nr:alpha/beta hydrolase [Kiritimatiellia bacterium]